MTGSSEPGPDIESILAAADASADRATTRAAVAGSTPATPPPSPVPTTPSAPPTPVVAAPPSPPATAPAAAVPFDMEAFARMNAEAMRTIVVPAIQNAVGAPIAPPLAAPPAKPATPILDLLKELKDVVEAWQEYVVNGDSDRAETTRDTIEDLLDRLNDVEFNVEEGAITVPLIPLATPPLGGPADPTVVSLRLDGSDTSRRRPRSVPSGALSKGELVTFYRMEGEHHPSIVGDRDLTDEIRRLADRQMSAPDIIKMAKGYGDGKMMPQGVNWHGGIDGPQRKAVQRKLEGGGGRFRRSR
jgi:hypothetical protein